MHQPLSIAKVRKETKLTVPAGGWVIVCSPDQPFSEHAAFRQRLNCDGQVNEKYATLAVGRMDNKYADIVFLTEEEKKAQDEKMKRLDASLDKSVADAGKRQEQIWKEQAAKDEKAHKEQVAALNVEHDAQRAKFKG